MKKLLILIVIFSLLLVGTVNADAIPTNYEALYELEQNFLDTSANNHDLDASFVTNTSESAVGNFAGNWTGNDGGFSKAEGTHNPAIIETSDFCISLWYRPTALEGAHTLVGDSAGSSSRFSLFVSNDKVQSSIYDGSSFTFANLYDTALIAGSWYHILLNWDTINLEIYVNNTLGAGAPSSQQNSAAAFFGLGYQLDSVDKSPANGTIDQVYIYDYECTAQMRSDLFAEFSGPIPPSPEGTQIIEQTVLIEQVGTIGISSTSYTNIINGTFNITNTTNVIGSWRAEIDSRNVNDVSCRGLIDGKELNTEANRSFSNPNELASLFVYSTNLTLQPGEHSAAFQCKRNSGVSFFNVNNVNAVVHVLDTDNGTNINFLSTTVVVPINSTSFVELGRVNFTTSNLTTGNLNISLVFEGSIEYRYGNASNISLTAQIDGENTPSFIRYGDAGSIGSGGGLFVKKNVSANQNITFVLFGKSSSGDGEAKVTFAIKEFVTNINETGIDIAEGSTINTSWQIINTVNINNSDHANANLVAKTVNSYITTSDNTISIMLGNDVTNGTIITRDLLADKSGVVFSQDVFQGISTGSHNVHLWAMVDVGTATVNNGSTIAYLTDNIAFDSTSFDVTLFDEWDNSSLTNFNVTVISTGNTFSDSGTGIALITPNSQFEDLLIQKNDYINRTVIAHEFNTNLNQSIFQSNITFNAFEIITNNQLFNVSYTIDGRTLIINDTGFFPLKTGDYNVTATKEGFFDRTIQFSVTPLDIKIINVTSMSASVINLTVRNIINGSFLPSFSGTITAPSISFSDTFVTNNFTVLIPIASGADYTIQLNTIQGMSDFGNSINITNEEITGSTLNKTIDLFTNNSINFTIRSFENGSLLNQQVNITLLGSTITYNLETSNGILYVDQRNDDTYQTTFSANGFSDTVLFLTVQDNSHLNIEIFMQTGLVSKDFIVKDNNLVPIDGAVLTFNTIVNGTSIVVAQIMTDFSGRATVLLDESITYQFTSAITGFDTFAGEVTPTQDEYGITMIASATGLFTTQFDDISYAVTFSYTAGNSIASSGLFINSILGSLEYFGLTATYNGTTFTTNITTSPGGGFPNITINGIDPTINSTLIINYFFKTTTNNKFSFEETYFLPSVGGTNISIGNGLFSEVTDLDSDDPMRGIIGMFIVAIGVLVFLGATKNMTVGVIGGLIGTALNRSLGLWPNNIAIITLIVGIVLIIADNIR